MSTVAPGWYKDPADLSTQRYWDGEGWLGDPIPADAEPPTGPPPAALKLPPAGIAATAAASGAAAAGPAAGAAPAPMAPPAGPATPTAGVGAPRTAAGAPPTATGAPPGWTPGGPGLHRGGPRPHGLVLAHAGSRFVARMVDTLIVAVMCVVANAWFAVQWWRAVEPSVSVGMKRIMAGQPTTAEDLPVPPTSANVLLFLIFFVAVLLWFLYEVPGSASSGQTLGKRLLGIKVVRLDSEERLGFARALRRWGRLGLPTLLWPCYGVGFLLQLLDCLFVVIDRPLRQALHDKAAATVVVQVGRPNPSDRVPPSESSHGGRDAHPR